MAIAETRCGVSPQALSIANSEFTYEVNEVTKENKWKLMARAMPLHQVLNYEPDRVLEEVFNNTEGAGEIVFAKTSGPKPKDVGFVAQRLVPITFEGRTINVLSILTKVVEPEYHKQNIGTELAIEALQRLDPDYVTGRTQNPFVIRAYERTGEFKDIMPIAKPHTYSPKMQLLLVLTLGLEGVKGTDLRTGLCEGAYPAGENRTFVLDNASERVLEIYTAMTSSPIGAVIENGDAIRYLAPRDKRTRSHPAEKNRVDKTPTTLVDIDVTMLTRPKGSLAASILNSDSDRSSRMARFFDFINRWMGSKTPAPTLK